MELLKLKQSDLDILKAVATRKTTSKKQELAKRSQLSWAIWAGGYQEAAEMFKYVDPNKPTPVGSISEFTVNPNAPAFQDYAKQVRAYLFNYAGKPEWAW